MPFHTDPIPHAEAAGFDRKNFGGQMISHLDKEILAMANRVGTSAGAAKDFFQYIWEAPGNIMGQLSSPFHGKPENPDYTEKRYRLSEARDELWNLVNSDIDPLRPTVGWLNDTVEMGLVQAPGAVLPSVAVSLTGPYAAIPLFALDFTEANRLEALRRGVDREHAPVIGAVAAPLQAATEYLSMIFSLGRFKPLAKALSRFSAPTSWSVGRYLQNAGASLAVEFPTEQLQGNAILPAVQEGGNGVRVRQLTDLIFRCFAIRLRHSSFSQQSAILSKVAPFSEKKASSGKWLDP
ncbi:hypothetical protein WJU23_14440 [Prosthecobacter sp. SYSU 5D2]|uniref:hypothetical protein n=1 Tax=Prosthecobacter sp. SYSU 5D2 TaxID=3134134 RepID=UPI0031FEECB5